MDFRIFPGFPVKCVQDFRSVMPLAFARTLTKQTDLQSLINQKSKGNGVKGMLSAIF